MTALRVTPTATGVRISIHVQPRASRAAVGGLHGDALKVRVTAPPVEGAANDAVVVALAEALRVPRRAVRIIGGESSRAKTVEIDGIGTAAIEALAGKD